MKNKFLMIAVAAGALGLSGAASAEIVTATFTGTVNLVFNPDGGLPPAADGDTFVATYVFNLDNATSSNIGDTGGFSAGPYGAFATVTVSINGTPAGSLPAFTTGELTGETQVFETGSVIDADVGGLGVNFDSNITGTDFAWNLTSPASGFSYMPTAADQTLIQLHNNGSDLIEADISDVEITVASPPPAVPEPSTWAMMLVGFAAMGFAGYRARKRGLRAI